VTDETLEAGPVRPGTAEAVDAVSAAEEQPREDRWFRQARRSTAFWIGLAIVLLGLIFGVLSGGAFTRDSNLLSIGLNSSQIMLLAVGMTFLIGAGQLDLSVGFNVIMSSVVAAKVMVALGGTAEQVAARDYPNLIPAVAAGIVAAIAVGAAGGLLNGLLVTRLRINSFIVTLATSGMFYGIALILTSAANVPFLPQEIQTYFGAARDPILDKVPLPLIVALIIAAVFWWIMRRTRFGLHTLAIGSSREAALRAGIDVDRQLLKLFVLMGVLVGIAGLYDLVRYASTNVVGHQTDNLQAISAVVIGGTSLFGGVASIGGSLLGTLIPVMMGNGLIILRVQPFYQLIAVGIILVIAVYLDQRRRGGNA
jgi:ribose transport system permease protein